MENHQSLINGQDVYPTYAHINLLRNYWKMRRLHKIGMYVHVGEIIVLQNRLKISYTSSLSIEDINEEIKAAYKKKRYKKKK